MIFYKETMFRYDKMGRFPADWEMVKLEEVLSLLRNGIVASQNKEAKGFPVTRIETISNEKIDLEKLGYLEKTDNLNLAEYRLVEGDILFSHINSLEHIGKTALYEGSPELLLHGMNLLLLRPKRNVANPQFMLYLLKLFKERKLFWAMAKKAVNQASINQTELGRVKVIVPPMKEQMRIVAVLSCVDLAIQKTDEVIAKAERLKKGLMQKLLTEGIGHKEFKDTEIGKMPNSWEAVKMKTVCPQIVGGVAIKTSDFQESGFQVLSKGDIKEFGQLILDKKQKKFVSQKFASKFPSQIVGFDDTVIALRDLSTAMDFLGLAANITVDQQYLVAQGVGILKLERRKVLPAFITNLSNSDRYRTFIKRKGVGSTQVHMRPHELLAFILGLPSLNEQREIVDRFSLVDRKLQIEKKTKAKLERIKQNLMETLLTGKIRVKVD